MRMSVLAIGSALIFTQIPAARNHWPTKGWPSSTPRAERLDPEALARLDADIAGGKYGYVDSMLVTAGLPGRVVCEAGEESGVRRRYARPRATRRGLSGTT